MLNDESLSRAILSDAVALCTAMGLQILSGFGIGKFAFQASQLSRFQMRNDTSKGLIFV